MKFQCFDIILYSYDLLLIILPRSVTLTSKTIMHEVDFDVRAVTCQALGLSSLKQNLRGIILSVQAYSTVYQFSG